MSKPLLATLQRQLDALRAAPMLSKGQAAEAMAETSLALLRDLDNRLSALEMSVKALSRELGTRGGLAL